MPDFDYPPMDVAEILSAMHVHSTGGREEDAGYGPYLIDRLADNFLGNPLPPSEQLVVSITVVTFAKLHPWARGATITVSGAGIRFYTDGSRPTASLGLVGLVTSTITITGRSSLLGFNAIRSGASDATLDIAYYD